MHSLIRSMKWSQKVVLFYTLVALTMIRNGSSYTTTTKITAPKISTTMIRNAMINYQRIGHIVSMSTTSSSNSVQSSKNDATNNDNNNMYIRTPLLNFRDNNDTINYIDRLDDSIMGGISTSTVRQVPVSSMSSSSSSSSSNQQQQQQMYYAIWSGICRTDGGGFCGYRTNPFIQPLYVLENNTIGFYMKCRFVSDNEPYRRIWKFTTRTKPDRGELLYQAPFQFNTINHHKDYDDTNINTIPWQTIYVPFDTFRLVRGPRIVDNGPQLNISQGIYQLGMTMSQFIFASNNNSSNSNNTIIEKTLPNFRDGYFEVHIEEIGVYGNSSSSTSLVVNTVNSNDINSTVEVQKHLEKEPIEPLLNVYTKGEVKQKQSMITIMFFVILRLLFFTEQSQRRKSTLKILQKKYNMSRFNAILWGYKRRLSISTIKYNDTNQIQYQLRYCGRMITSMFKTISILSIDTIRFIFSSSLKLVLLYPIRFTLSALNRIKSLFGKSKNKLKSSDTATIST